ncbi:hypothetical protein MKW98_026740, partial [Papaver atlanticum]
SILEDQARTIPPAVPATPVGFTTIISRMRTRRQFSRRRVMSSRAGKGLRWI